MVAKAIPYRTNDSCSIIILLSTRNILTMMGYLRDQLMCDSQSVNVHSCLYICIIDLDTCPCETMNTVAQFLQYSLLPQLQDTVENNSYIHQYTSNIFNSGIMKSTAQCATSQAENTALRTLAIAILEYVSSQPSVSFQYGTIHALICVNHHCDFIVEEWPGKAISCCFRSY